MKPSDKYDKSNGTDLSLPSPAEYCGEPELPDGTGQNPNICNTQLGLNGAPKDTQLYKQLAPDRLLSTLNADTKLDDVRYSCTLTSNSPDGREMIMNLWFGSQQLNLSFPPLLFTSQSLSVELPLLDEPAEHLGLHEDLQEATYGLRWDCFAKTLTLEGASDRGGGRGRVAVFPFTRGEEWIVAHQLHEETHEGLGHHGAKMARI
ncbi:hypothetical protein EYF80_017915 [Liparis tanakae]|uniref:Uncharacterized protein n=1 Tax=Liparis tanakae TaxID=230148 RepID=A0A4Z2I1U6_9TELE|nr:hypothetical protein EYF80_017915 [Liparis tanakae]